MRILANRATIVRSLAGPAAVTRNIGHGLVSGAATILPR